MAVFPRNCAEEKVQTGSAAAGGHRRVATRKTTGDLTTRRGAGDPVRRAEWTTVLRYGHLRSALVVVDACVRTEWEPPTLRAALSISTRPSRRLLDASCLSNDAHSRLCCNGVRVVAKPREGPDVPRDREAQKRLRSREQVSSRDVQKLVRGRGLDRPLARSPIGEESRRSPTFTSLRAVHVTATPCATWWLGRPLLNTSQTDSFQ